MSKQILGYGCLCAVLLGTAACAPHRIPPMTVEDLMEDRVSLDGIMMKCNQNPARLSDTQDCENARIAIERLMSQNADPSVEKKRQEQFERARERLRLAQERLRQEQEQQTKVDAYTLPVVPVNPSPAPNTTATPPSAEPAGASPPLAGTTTP
ncbi:MAG TPA: EexN family lipoprotein [Steroidobacteraceae bacterium]|nr:EexN family lipoprotein [Steroidobacteraceae bacterium]